MTIIVILHTIQWLNIAYAIQDLDQDYSRSRLFNVIIYQHQMNGSFASILILVFDVDMDDMIIKNGKAIFLSID